MAEYGVNIAKLALVTALAAILTTAVIVGLQAVYYWYQAGLEQSLAQDATPAKLEKVMAAQRAQLTGYYVSEDAPGKLQIPIEQAMREVVQDLSAGKAGGAGR